MSLNEDVVLRGVRGLQEALRQQVANRERFALAATLKDLVLEYNWVARHLVPHIAKDTSRPALGATAAFRPATSTGTPRLRCGDGSSSGRSGGSLSARTPFPSARDVTDLLEKAIALLTSGLASSRTGAAEPMGGPEAPVTATLLDTEQRAKLLIRTYCSFALLNRHIGNAHTALRYLTTALGVAGKARLPAAELHINSCAALSTLGRHREALRHIADALTELEAAGAAETASTSSGSASPKRSGSPSRPTNEAIENRYLYAAALFNAAAQCEHIREQGFAQMYYTLARDKAKELLSMLSGRGTVSSPSLLQDKTLSIGELQDSCDSLVASTEAAIAELARMPGVSSLPQPGSLTARPGTRSGPRVAVVKSFTRAPTRPSSAASRKGALDTGIRPSASLAGLLDRMPLSARAAASGGAHTSTDRTGRHAPDFDAGLHVASPLAPSRAAIQSKKLGGDGTQLLFMPRQVPLTPEDDALDSNTPPQPFEADSMAGQGLTLLRPKHVPMTERDDDTGFGASIPRPHAQRPHLDVMEGSGELMFDYPSARSAQSPQRIATSRTGTGSPSRSQSRSRGLPHQPTMSVPTVNPGRPPTLPPPLYSPSRDRFPPIPSR